MAASTPPPSPSRLDLRAITETLRGGRANDAWMASWLAISHSDPAAFMEVAHGFAGARRGSILKSEVGGGVDLYHDFVIALQGRRRTALVSRENGEWVGTSYESLHARCNALASAWVEQGAEAGQSVAIIAAPGLDQAVSLLTALRIGMIPTLIPPHGPTFVRKALARCEAERIAIAGRIRGLAGASVDTLPVSAGARSTGSIGSFTYPPGQPAARLLSPFGTTENGLAEVSAQTLLDGAVRDALFVHGLEPGEVLAAPGFDAVQHEPGLLLAALVVGAARAYISEEELEEDPALLGQLGVRVLGLRRRLRDRWMREQRRLPASLRAWFRSLTDTVDGDRWDDFFRTILTPKQCGFSVVNGAGGAMLFSAPSAAPPGMRVWPTPGLPWRLGEIGAGEVRAHNDSGVFSVLRGEEVDPALPRVVVGRWGEGWAYGGSMDVGPEARPYPSADVEEVVTKLPAVRHAAAFSVPGRWVNEARVVLLVFVEAQRPREPSPVELPELERLVRRELGEAYVPDRIEVLPLRPRIAEGGVDRVWCRSQYLTGMLHRKARSDVFVLLGRLGYIFATEEAPR